PLVLPAATPRRVDADALARFFEHPVRTFVQQRLLVYLGQEAEPLPVRQPLELDHLENWKIGDRLLRHVLAGADPDTVQRALGRSGDLPPGALGRFEYLAIRPQAEEIAAAARHAAPACAPLAIDHVIDGTHVTGVLRDLWADAHRRVQFGRAGHASEMGFWVRHLLLNCFAPDGYPRVSRLVARDSGTRAVRIELAPVDGAAGCLETLLELYWQGLERPLPFFRSASAAYAQHLQKHPADGDGALAAAGLKYSPSGDEAYGDRDDAYVRQVFGAGDLREILPDGGAEFARVALQIWGPLLAVRREA
ncbi:MAG: hypothetical protein ACRERC_04825, partial [Candidatus Binatia bacterium]